MVRRDRDGIYSPTADETATCCELQLCILCSTALLQSSPDSGCPPGRDDSESIMILHKDLGYHDAEAPLHMSDSLEASLVQDEAENTINYMLTNTERQQTYGWSL